MCCTSFSGLKQLFKRNQLNLQVIRFSYWSALELAEFYSHWNEEAAVCDNGNPSGLSEACLRTCEEQINSWAFTYERVKQAGLHVSTLSLQKSGNSCCCSAPFWRVTGLTLMPGQWAKKASGLWEWYRDPWPTHPHGARMVSFPQSNRFPER